MPQAIPAIAAAFATATASATAFVSALAFKGTLMAGLAAWGKVATYAALAASLFMKPPGLQGSGQNINIQLAGSTAPLPILLGMTGTQGLVTLRKTYADKNEVLAVDTVLSIGPVESIESFSVMDRGITYTGDPHTGTALITGVDGVDMKASKLFRYGGFTFAHRTGEPDDYDTISDILGEAVPEIGPEHGMPGLARTIFRLKLDEKQLNFPQGFPDNPVSVVKGIKCYDPRKDSTQTSIGGSGSHRFDDPATHEWTENPAILALNFGLGVYNQHNGRKLFGLGLGQGNHRSALDSVNFAQFAAAANVCDANRWTCGGVVTTQDNRWAIVTNIMASGGAVPLNSGGRLGCFVRAPKISVFTLRADDVIGTRKITTGQPISQRANRIIPNYRSPDHKYEIVAGTALTHETWLSDDRYDVRTTETTYPLVQNPVQAGQLAAYELADSREFLEAEITCKPRALNVEVGDCIETDLTEFNPGQEWIVVDRRWNSSTKTVTLTLKAETYEKHAFCLGNSTIPPRTPTLRTDDPTRHPGPDTLDWDIVDNKIVGPRVVEVAPGIWEERPHTIIPAIVIEGEVRDPNVNKVIVETRPWPWNDNPTNPGEPTDPLFDQVALLANFDDGLINYGFDPDYDLVEGGAYPADFTYSDDVPNEGFGLSASVGYEASLITAGIPTGFGDGEFTVEFRYAAYMEAPYSYVIGQYGDVDGQKSWAISNTNFRLNVMMSSDGVNDDLVNVGDVASLMGQWHTICLERTNSPNGDFVRLYFDGQMVMKEPISGALFDSTAPLILNGPVNGDWAAGSVLFDDVRITTVARYSDDDGYVVDGPFPTQGGGDIENPGNDNTVSFLTNFGGLEGNEMVNVGTDDGLQWEKAGIIPENEIRFPFAGGSERDDFNECVRLPTGASLVTNYAPAAFLGSDWTVEFRYKRTSAYAPVHYLFGQYERATNQRSWVVGLNDYSLMVYLSSDGVNADMVQRTDLHYLEPDHWYSICLERSGGDVRLYVDGAMVMKETVNGDLFHSSAPLILNSTIDGPNSSDTGDGWFDEVRITNTWARYASDDGYTPADAAFPTDIGGGNEEPNPDPDPGPEEDDDGWSWAAEGQQTVSNFTLAPMRPNQDFEVSIKYVTNGGAISERMILGPVTTASDIAGGVGRDVIDWRNVIRNSLTSLSASYVATEENLTGTTPFEVAECWVDVEGITTPVEVDFNAFFSFVHDAGGTFTTNFEIRRSPDSGPGVQILHMSHDGTGLRNDTLAGMYPFKVIDRPSSGIWRYVMRVWSNTDNFTVQKTQCRFIRATEYKTNGTAPPPETP